MSGVSKPTLWLFGESGANIIKNVIRGAEINNFLKSFNVARLRSAEAGIK